MDPEGSLPFSQDPTFVPILNQTNIVNTLPNIFNFNFNIIPLSMPGLRGGVFEGTSHQIFMTLEIFDLLECYAALIVG